jgi:hypothetical protein
VAAQCWSWDETHRKIVGSISEQPTLVPASKASRQYPLHQVRCTLLIIRQLPKTRRALLSLCPSHLSFSLARSLLLRSSVALKIETIRGKEGTSIKLIGRLRAEALLDLEAEIKASARVIALEMDEVTLVDLDVVRFLSACESQGIELRGCPPYIRQWIAQEKKAAIHD